jgi:hypothetical protein
VVPGFFENFFRARATGDEITIHTDVPTPENFCHFFPPPAAAGAGGYYVVDLFPVNDRDEAVENPKSDDEVCFSGGMAVAGENTLDLEDVVVVVGSHVANEVPD